MRNFSNLSKIVYLTVILFTAYTFEVFAATQYAPRLSPQEKMLQLKQEAPSASTEVSTKCQEIISYVNSVQTPSDPNIKELLKIITRNRKYLSVFDKSQQSTYHILSAWVYYFDNKPDKALKQASLGKKASPQNSNTVKTLFTISLVYKDYASAIEALTEQDASKNRVPKPNEAEYQYSQQTNVGDFQLDVSAVRTEPLGKVFDFHPEPVGPNSTSWQSPGRVACALLWKIDANEFDSFAPAETAKPAAEANTLNEPNMPVSPAPKSAPAPAPSSEALNESSPPPQTESEQQGGIQQTQASAFAEFAQLQSLFAKNKKVVFAAINLNNPEKRKNLEGWLDKNPRTCPTFLLTPEGQQKMTSLLGESNRAVLLIVGPNSTIRYAGDVNGFLPQMVINSILANPQEFAEPNEPNLTPAASLAEPSAVAGPKESNLPAVQHARPPAESNITPALTTDVNKAAVNTQQPLTQPNKPNTTANAVSPEKQKADDGFSVADDYQAEKLLSNARTFLQIGNKLPSHEYRNPIEWCRQVMKDYPNTKYAQEAQMLLRNVPKEHRAQYNITDEELGL
jgi:LysM repeat protein